MSSGELPGWYRQCYTGTAALPAVPAQTYQPPAPRPDPKWSEPGVELGRTCECGATFRVTPGRLGRPRKLCDACRAQRRSGVVLRQYRRYRGELITMSDGRTPRQWAVDLLDGDSHEKWVRAGTVLVAALIVGPEIKPLVRATGVPYSDVSHFSYQLRRAGIWKGRGETAVMTYEWLDALLEDGPVEAGIVGFVLQVGVAVGAFVRTEDGRYRAALGGEFWRKTHRPGHWPLKELG